MHRPIAAIVALFLLFANLAWATDLEEFGVTPGDDVVAWAGCADSGQAGGESGHDGGQKAPCDHCCHGGGHYLGLPSSSLDARADAGPARPAPHMSALLDRDREPPLQPPRI